MEYILGYFFLQNMRNVFYDGGLSMALKFLPNVILLIGVLRYMAKGHGKIYFPKIVTGKNLFYWLIFLLLFIGSLLRTAYTTATPIGMFNDSFSVIMLNLLAFLWVGVEVRKGQDFEQVFNRTVFRLLIIIGVVVTMYCFLYFFGYKDPRTPLQRGGELNVLLKLVGIKLMKKMIPYTASMHPNTISVWAGATFIMTTIYWYVVKTSLKRKIWLYAIMFFAGIFMMIADSRGTALMVVAGMGLVAITYFSKATGFLRVFVLAVPFLPFMFMLGLQAMSSASFLSTFSRTGDAENVTTMSGRTHIWAECIKEIEKFKLQHMIGWGEHGQSTAGVSKNYTQWFGEDEYEYGYDLIVTHNFFFQVFFDTGYLGVLFFMLSSLAVMNGAIYLYNRGYKAALVFVGLSLYYVLSGALESNFGNHNRGYNEVMMMSFVIMLSFKNEFERLQLIYERENTLVPV